MPGLTTLLFLVLVGDSFNISVKQFRSLRERERERQREKKRAMGIKQNHRILKREKKELGLGPLDCKYETLRVLEITLNLLLHWRE